MLSVHTQSFCAAALLTGLLTSTASADMVWINEFHYDNTGADAGEFVEIVVGPGGPATSDINISLYNGANGLVYASINLADAGVVVGSNVMGYQFYVWNFAGIQNGAPDGIALDVSGTLNEFISYEGAFNGAGGPAAGMGSVDIGLIQSGSEPVGSSLGLTGTGGDQVDFTWAAFNDPGNNNGATPGMLNVGQTIPAPGALAAFGLAGLLGRGRRRN